MPVMAVGPAFPEPDGWAFGVVLLCGLMPHAARMADSESALPTTRPPWLARRRNDRRDIRPSLTRRAIACSIWVSSRRSVIGLSFWAVRVHGLVVVRPLDHERVLGFPGEPDPLAACQSLARSARFQVLGVYGHVLAVSRFDKVLGADPDVARVQDRAVERVDGRLG